MKNNITIRESFRLGKGWHLMIFAIASMLVANAGTGDGLNVVLPAIVKNSGMGYEVCLSMGTLAGFLGVGLMILVGKLRNRVGSRTMSFVLLVILSLTFSIPFIHAKNIWVYMIAQAVLITCGQSNFYLCTGPMQSDWFPRKRGVVNGISTIGSNIGTAILAPLLSWLIAWTGSINGLCFVSVFGVALAVYGYVFLRDDPLDAGMYPDNVSKEVYESEYLPSSGNPSEEQGRTQKKWSVVQMLRMPEVWGAALVPGLMSLGLLGIVTQFIPRCLSLGMTEARSMACLSAAGIFGIFGSYALGFIDTRLGTKRAAIIYALVFALGIAFNLLASLWLPFIYPSILIIGLSLGGCTNITLSFPAYIFGKEDYPLVNGVIFPINYCIGCLNFTVNALALKIGGSLQGAYVIYLFMFLADILIILRASKRAKEN